MMANPLPIVLPDNVDNNPFKELEEVKVQQPHPTPRPCATYEVLVPCAKLKEKDQEDYVVFVPTDPKAEAVPAVLPVMQELTRVDALADLEPVERINCTRRLHVKNTLTMKGTKNTFFIQTPNGNVLYTIQEENRWWTGYCLDGLRPLILKVMNTDGVEVIRMSRPFAFTTRILPCQLQTMNVYSPPEHLIGTITQRWSALRPYYVVKDIYGQIIFEIHGPRITISCFQDVTFHINRPDGTLMATTSKRWEGVIHALFVSPVVDTFNLSFVDKNLASDEKALILATALLLDYMYYDI